MSNEQCERSEAGRRLRICPSEARSAMLQLSAIDERSETERVTAIARGD